MELNSIPIPVPINSPPAVLGKWMVALAIIIISSDITMYAPNICRFVEMYSGLF